MLISFAYRLLSETDPRLLCKFVYSFGYKGMRSVELYKKRLARGEHFPPFLFVSIINSCQLRCQGCWVDVEAPRKYIDLADCVCVCVCARARACIIHINSQHKMK